MIEKGKSSLIVTKKHNVNILLRFPNSYNCCKHTHISYCFVPLNLRYLQMGLCLRECDNLVTNEKRD